VPIPAGSGENFAGLITIDLPLGVQSGQVFNVTVKRLGTRRGKRAAPPPRLNTAPAVYHPGGAALHTAPGQSHPPITPPTEIQRSLQWRYVVGTFQIRIPVTTGDRILPSELTTLAIMKWRLEHMPLSNRWYPVLVRYIQYVSDRVDGLGGDSAAVPPSLTYVPPLAPPHQHHHGERELCGKVVEVLFDCHGEFTGFLLDGCCAPRLFHSRSRSIGELVLRACRDGLTLCVWVDAKHGDKIYKLAIKP
jgi:hypothetical protein